MPKRIRAWFNEERKLVSEGNVPLERGDTLVGDNGVDWGEVISPGTNAGKLIQIPIGELASEPR